MEKPKSNFGYLKLPEDVSIFKPEGATEVVFDILPYKVTDENHMDNKKYEEDAVVGNYWWKRPLRVHRDVGPDNSVLVCPTTFGDKCPICEYGARRRKEGAEWDELKTIFPKNRTIFLINMIDSADCEVDYEEDTLHIMDQSDYLFLEALDDEIKRDIDNEGFPDPYNGLSVRIYFKKKKNGKFKYAEASKIDFEERDQQYDDEYLETLPDIDGMVKILDYKEIEALYFGMEGMDDTVDDEVEDDRPSRRRKTTSRRSSSRKRREKTEDDEPEVIEEDQEEKPSRRSRSRRTEEKAEPEEKAVPKITPEKLDSLARRGLNKLAKDLEMDPTDYATDELEQLREDIATKLEIELPAADPDPEPEPEEAPTRRTRRSKPEAEEENKCPAGLVYGTDNDQFDDCDTCKVWDACADEKEDK